MSNKRTTMRKLREILRLRLQIGLSIRAISRSTKLSVGGVQKLLSRAEALSLTWPLPAALDDARLAALFYPGADADAGARREVPDWAASVTCAPAPISSTPKRRLTILSTCRSR